MKYVAAYALLTIAGKKDISTADLAGFLKKAGVTVDETAAETVVNALKGKQLHEVVASGMTKVSSLSFGGGAGGATAAAPAQGGSNAAQAPAPAAKVEEPPKEEEAVSMGGLFD